MATTHRAKRISLNRWLQTVDSFDPPETAAAFKTRTAARFGIAETDIEVVATDWTTAQRETCAAELASGTHEGLSVIAAPVAPKAPAGRDFLKNGVVPNITGATTGAKLDRLATIAIADPAIGLGVNVCNTYETLTGGDHTFLRKVWGKKKTEAQGGLSASEVSAIEAAAPTYGITLP